MHESMKFTYDGVNSDDFGVVMVSENGGLFGDSFLPTRKIIEKTIAGNNRVYFKSVEEQQFSTDMTIWLKDWKDKKNLRDVARWLSQDWYKPLWFETNPNRVYYALIEGSSDLVHNGLRNGYIKVKVKCNSPYSYSQVLKYDAIVNGSLTTYIYNDGDKTCYPYIKIKKKGNGDIKIKATQEGKLVANMEIKSLLDGEIIDIDCETQDISTGYESQGRYLIDNHNDEWLEFPIGNIYDGDASTKIEMTGNFEIEMEYQYKYLTE